MRLFKKIVDEREELELLRVERVAFYVLFWGLVAAIHVQIFLDGFTFRQIAGEFFLLIIAAVIAVGGCFKKGLWSYSTKPTVKSNLLYSSIGSFFFSFVSLVLQYKRLSGAENVGIDKFVAGFIINFAAMFVLGFILLTISGFITNRRKAKLEKNFDENSNE